MNLQKVLSSLIAIGLCLGLVAWPEFVASAPAVGLAFDATAEDNPSGSVDGKNSATKNSENETKKASESPAVDANESSSDHAESNETSKPKTDADASSEAKDPVRSTSPAASTPSESKKDTTEKEVPAKVQVRSLALSGNYVDKIQPTSLDPLSLISGSVPLKQKSFYRLCEYLDKLINDDKVDVVVFDLSDSALAINSAQLDELARRLAKLSEKKRTIAWLENADNVHMAIASCCRKAILADFGGLDLASASLETMYYRDAMDLMGVKASVVRAGDFKGAVEPYTRSEMSPHLRRHYEEMLNTMNDARIDRIARGRGLPRAKVRELQRQRFILPNEALASGLVDQLAPYGSMKESIDRLIGKETEWTQPKRRKKRQMSFFEVMSSLMSGPRSSSSRIRDNTIAILHINGPIVDGKKQRGSSVVSGPTVEAIREIANEEKIKGVVVRVDSPGGSATASESIRQALVDLAKKKPTIVSMGRVAASGGYWVSCIDVPIYAEKSTITGSIGVFSMKLSCGTLLNRIGVKIETIALDDSAGAFALDRVWSDDDIATLTKTVDQVYDRFLKLVSESRGLAMDRVSELAGGRVWSGAQAKQHGLIDDIGGVDQCLQVVAKKAGLDDYHVIHRPTPTTGLGILDLLGESDEDEIFANLPRPILASIASRRLSLAVTRALLSDGLHHSKGMPTVWLLGPAEWTVK